MASSPPSDRKYLQSHEWHQRDGDSVTIGITQAAADELTDITFVELPAIGAMLEAGKPFGVIESVKATSDLYSGVSGTVMDVNEQLRSAPGLINNDPYITGWMIKVKMSDPTQLDQLLSLEDYVKSSGH